ncbi:MAG: DEAD/DEAH box helicase family protein [Clostridia bacterium]|nr:DEAD/DEAH box helicase family protein [Clostridia bacterium]
MSRKNSGGKTTFGTAFSLLERLLEDLKKSGGKITATDIGKVIGELNNVKSKTERSEAIERQKLEQEEAERIKAESEKERQAHIEEVTSMELPLDWENAFIGDERTAGVHADSISDGLILSLSNLAKVDIEYISSITGEDYKTVICALKGSIYQNPETWEECFYKGWETAEEYLSGNLMRKWNAAQEANKEYNGYFEDNLKALSSALPDMVDCKDIYITLGSPWVPVDIIDQFIAYILNLSPSRYIGTKHDEITGTWEIPNKSSVSYKYNVASTNTYGTARLEALYILEKTLNMKTVAVTDEVSCLTNASGKKRVINEAETVMALEKQQKLIKTFQQWVWQDKGRRERLESIFESNFSCVRKRSFDGSFLKFPSMSPTVSLFPYQKDAVARIILTPNTLLAHDVGSGKTYVMIAAGMELKRMGLSLKNLYVVPNNIVGQWKGIFKEMYPNANLLCVEPKSFTKEKREKVLEKIRDGDYDGIIMAYSCYEQIPLSKEFYMQELKELKEQITDLTKNSKKATAKLNKKRQEISTKMAELAVTISAGGIYFDELGITRMFVDEAHNYKNVPIETKVDRVLGISSSGSKKCKDMMNKVRLIQKNNNGGGVVMATGTPITNSITDAYVMQKYLQGGELALLDLQSFDSWIGMFAERVTEFEIDVDTSNYRLATRFARFHNLPELTALFSSIADFHRVDSESGVPDFDGYHDALIGKTRSFAEYLENISHRAETVRKGGISRTDDNMLKITTDGRKAALDMRLVEPNEPFTYQSKVARCAENVFDIYIRTHTQSSAQLIFCDSSTPKAGFNVYDELKRLLVSMGIPEEKIAYIHDAETDRRREKLFRMVRNGEIRILIGSTFKLGLGVNVQERLIAVHHLDVPWRPADMTQREGRILRQGNTNQRVFIYRYITEGSFDAYSWQLLETKQRFIEGLLSGSITERSGSDIESTVLDYAEVKALAVGNPLIKERVETANELTRYLSLQRKAIDTNLRLKKELDGMPKRIERQGDLIVKCKDDIAFYKENRRDYDKEERKALRTTLYNGVRENLLMQNETPFMEYQGFTVVLPMNMTAEKPFIWLQKNGRYYLELGDTEKGGLIRVDNFLDGLDKHLEKLSVGYDELCKRQEDIKTELTKTETYEDKIKETQKKLSEIDKKLGVDKL